MLSGLVTGITFMSMHVASREKEAWHGERDSSSKRVQGNEVKEALRDAV